MTEAQWTPPQYDMTRPPELSNTYTFEQNNFARAAKWCPDGTEALLQCEDHSLQLFASSADLQRSLVHPSPLVDYAWFPYASKMNPATYCFVTSVRDCPIKLLDAKGGRLRASYPIVDHRERFIAPHCLAFTPYGERLYCGFEDAIEVFDFAAPGEGTRLHTTPTKKSKDGLKGIVSSLTFAGPIFAAGTLNPTTGNIALFDERQGEEIVMFVEGGAATGVNQLTFNPVQTHILYAGFRRRSAIYAWDIRADVTQPLKVLDHDLAEPTNNQRIKFSVDPAGKWVATGTSTGHVVIFEEDTTIKSDRPTAVAPQSIFQAHQDVVPCVSFNPSSSQLCTVSGSRNFDSLESSESESEDEDTNESSPAVRSYPRVRQSPTVKDATAKFWNFDGPSS